MRKGDVTTESNSDSKRDEQSTAYNSTLFTRYLHADYNL